MRCWECGTLMKHVSDGSIKETFKTIGKLVVSGLEYDECPKCGEIMFTPETSRKIDRAYGARLRELLRQSPVADFMQAVDAAKLLGITKQAFSTNKRIRRGFIYSYTPDDSRNPLYMRSSVEAFRKTGDGRIPLCPANAVATPLPAPSSVLPEHCQWAPADQAGQHQAPISDEAWEKTLTGAA